MDAHDAIRGGIAIIVIVMGVYFPVFASPVHIYSGDFDLPIPAPDDPESALGRGWMDDAIIEITDHFIIGDLDVSLTLTHESLFDLQIILQSPAGTNVALNLAGNPAFIARGKDGRLRAIGISGKLFFDDEADVSIEQAAEPFIGQFRPVWSLSSFDGEGTYGLWRLKICDAYYADSGTLRNFELMITTPEPATAAMLVLGACLLILFRPRKGG